MLRFDTNGRATHGPRFRFPALLAATLAVTGGCAGEQAAAPPPQVIQPAPAPKVEPPVHERGRDKLIVEVGPPGGILELGEGARVEIPRDAIAEPVSITFAVGPHTTAFDNREYEKTLGRTLELTPALTTKAPIEISIPLPQLPEGFEPEDLTLATEVPAERQRDYQEHATQTRWDYLQAEHVDGRARAKLDYVPGMRLQFLVSSGE